MLFLNGLVGLHRTVQCQLLKHYWLGLRLGGSPLRIWLFADFLEGRVLGLGTSVFSLQRKPWTSSMVEGTWVLKFN